MAFAPRHRGQGLCWCLTPIERTSVVRTGSGDPWPDSVRGRGAGLVPAPPLNFKILRFSKPERSRAVPLPVPARGATGSQLPSRTSVMRHQAWAQRFVLTTARRLLGDVTCVKRPPANDQGSRESRDCSGDHSSSSTPPTGIRRTCLRPSLISNSSPGLRSSIAV